MSDWVNTQALHYCRCVFNSPVGVLDTSPSHTCKVSLCLYFRKLQEAELEWEALQTHRRSGNI